MSGRSRRTVNALAGILVKRDVFNALACRRRRKSFGDFYLARKIPLAVLVSAIPKFVRQCAERLIHEFLFGCRCSGSCIQTRAVRRHGNAAARLRMADQQRTADDLLWIGSVMPVERAHVAAVLIDSDGIGLVLENHSRTLGRSAADKRGDAAAPIGFRQRRALVHVAPYGAVLQPHVECAVTVGKTLDVR